MIIIGALGPVWTYVLTSPPIQAVVALEPARTAEIGWAIILLIPAIWAILAAAFELFSYLRGARGWWMGLVAKSVTLGCCVYIATISTLILLWG